MSEEKTILEKVINRKAKRRVGSEQSDIKESLAKVLSRASLLKERWLINTLRESILKLVDDAYQENYPNLLASAEQVELDNVLKELSNVRELISMERE